MKNDAEKRVLFSSVCKPFGMKHGDGFGVSSEGTHQIMWAQGVFRTRATTTQWGIDFIAENIKAPTVTLHYPTIKQFIQEVKKGYDYVGIAFISSTMHKMIPMVKAIRRHAPGSKIILGGYGTALGEELEQYADHICHGEGVEFMRTLLGEDVNAPIVQPDITQTQSLCSIPMPGKTGYIFGGLGCPNGCDFCATSHHFKRKHIKFLPDGLSVLGAVNQMREKHPGMDQFWINDEDFLLDKKRGRGFLQAIRRSNLPPLSISIFSSVKALSQYTPKELVEMGVDWVWVGYEGQRSGYSKMEGVSYRELFADYHRHGISVLASMIIGFDYQTPDIIREEFEELISMRPSMCQFLIYGGPPGTPLAKRLEAEGRVDPAVAATRNKHDGFTLGFRHPHIRRKEMSAIQRMLYREEFQRLGPSVFRVVEDMLAGYVHLHGHQNNRIRDKASKYGRDARFALPLFESSKKYVSAEAAAWIDQLQQRLVDETGPVTAAERIQSRAAGAMLAYTDFKLRHGIGEQPEFTRKSFRMKGMEKHHRRLAQRRGKWEEPILAGLQETIVPD